MTSFGHFIFSLTAVSAIMYACAVDLTAFDCQRIGVNDCVSGTCGSDRPGVCSCNNGFTSYDCSHNLATAGSGCGSRCGDGSFCSADNTCLCPETRYNGANGACEYKTLQNSCRKSGKMLLNVNTPGVENLYVFVEGWESTCSLQSVGSSSDPGIPSDWRGKVRVVDLNDPTDCGAPTVTNNKVCVTVYIRYQRDYQSDVDSRVTFCCGDNEVNNVAQFGVVDEGTDNAADLPNCVFLNMLIVLSATQWLRYILPM